jgi:Protein of unknown function DUF262
MTFNSDDQIPAELSTIDINKLSPDAEDDYRSGYIPEEDDTPLDVPVSERRVVTQPYDFNVRTIIDQIDDGTLLVKPSYQRGYVWDDGRASRLIESLLMNIPIPPCYLAEDEVGMYSVIDGQQRLYSISRFSRDDFKLRALTTLTELNGKAFKDLTDREQRAIKSRFIRCIVITQESHREIRFEVFYRLNTGSMQLTDQEIRNAIYRGEFNDLIRSLADQPRWLNALGKKNLDKRMRDDELIVRFFAVHDRFTEYNSPLRSFLNKYVADKTSKNRKLETAEKERFTNLFEDTMDKVVLVFKDHAFRSYTHGWEKLLNRALFDAVSLVFSHIPAKQLTEKSSQAERALIDLCSDKDFFRTISRSTADRNSFFFRLSKFSQVMNDIGLENDVYTKI